LAIKKPRTALPAEIKIKLLKSKILDSNNPHQKQEQKGQSIPFTMNLQFLSNRYFFSFSKKSVLEIKSPRKTEVINSVINELPFVYILCKE